MLNEELIKENHQICLELLDKFLEICEKYDVEYYLAFGSCLGTIRHHGFIPWDINIDVLMKAEEFQRLESVMQQEDLGEMQWCCPDGSSRMFPLLMKKGTWNHPTHPNLDFSIYFRASDCKIVRSTIRKVSYFCIKMYKLKNTNVRRSFPFNILKWIATLFSDSCYTKFIKGIESSNNRKLSNYYSVLLPSVWDNREEIKTEWFGKEPVYGNFEGRKVRILENYHEYLTMRYGDYMTPNVWVDKGGYKHVAK